MHNAPKPNIEDLPTKAQLRRSTIIAATGAVAIGVMVYLPAEYGTDPTGVGNVLGLTEMGEIKQQLAAEAAADEALHGGDESLTCPPDGPSFITRVCGSGFHIRRCWFGQARRARSPQIAQASGALLRAFDFRAMSAA